MSIRSLTRRTTWIAVAIAGLLAAPAWLAATPPPPEGPSFTTLQDPFTQALYGASASVPADGFSILGGVAFAPDGRVWSAECTFLGTRLHRFAAGTTLTNGSNVHQEELIVDLTIAGPLGYDAGGCGLVNHPDGTMYSNSAAGIWQLNASTGALMGGPFGPGGNALGIAVDPQTSHIVYVGDDCHPSLNFDATTCTLWGSCAFDGDLIVVTGGGAPTVWRINSGGAATRIVVLPADVEGVVTVPNDATRFGPVAGRILTTGQDRVYAIDAGGDVVTLGDGAEYPMTLVPTLEAISPIDFSCSGVVSDVIEPATAGIGATLTRADVAAFRQTTTTGADGRFQFNGVCAGTYTVTLGVAQQ